MGLRKILRREFSFISGNYKVLVISWMIMDLATEMPAPNFQYYVQRLGGTGLALGIIGWPTGLEWPLWLSQEVIWLTSMVDVGS